MLLHQNRRAAGPRGGPLRTVDKAGKVAVADIARGNDHGGIGAQSSDNRCRLQPESDALEKCGVRCIRKVVFIRLGRYELGFDHVDGFSFDAAKRKWLV